MLKKLRLRFICSMMTIATVMLGIIFGLVVHFTAFGFEERSEQMLRIVVEGKGPNDSEHKPPKKVRGNYFVVRQTPWGEWEKDYDNFSGNIDEITLEKIMLIAFNAKDEIGEIPEMSLRFFRDDTHPMKAIAFSDISDEKETLSSLIRMCLLIGTASFIVLLLLSIFLARRVSAPVERAWKEQHQFVADASHELKTPLTIISTNAEMLKMPEYTDEQKEQFSDNILVTTQKMRGLVSGLLELAREDNGSLTVEFSRLDMSQLVLETVLPFEPIFYERGIKFSSEIDEGITVNGSKDYLHKLLNILLDNARKYCSDNGKVSVKLEHQGRQNCQLSVSSTGEEISREDIKNIFNRFYRVDKSRGEKSGYGLGLSIAQAIVKEHKGRIWAESEDSVNTFFVNLPMK